MARETMTEMLSDTVYDKEPRAKLIANNTVQFYRNGQKVIRLHHTDIMVWSKDGKTIALYTGGWRTVTTKDRLNRLMPGRSNIYSDKGLWYIARGVPFYDGIEIDAETGALADMAKLARKAACEGAKQKILAKQIDKFVKKIHELDELPTPNGGDCWVCSMFDRAEPAKPSVYGVGDRTGQKVRDPSHLSEHVKEGYLHGSLIVNAMRWAGYADQGIAYWFRAHKFDKERGAYYGRHSVPARALRRFLRSQLGLAT